MEKDLSVKNTDDCKIKVGDVVIVGNPDMFQLLCKASSKKQKWMKSTKAMEIEGEGVLVQVSTQQGNNVSEALAFIPRTKIKTDENGMKSIVSTLLG